MTPVFNLPSFSRSRRVFDGGVGAQVEQLFAAAYLGDVCARFGKIDARGACLVALFSLIPILFARCRPFTVFFGIAFIVVDSIKAHSLGFSAHIRKECGKGVQPPIANGYPSPAPVFVPAGIRVGASLLHAYPARILRRTGHPVSCDPVSVEASAALRVSGCKFATTNNCLVSTLAGTEPSVAASAIPLDVNSGKPAESLACKIFKAGVCWYTDVRHIATFYSDVFRGSVVPATDSHIIRLARGHA